MTSCCPKGSVKTDWEVELGIVIGTRARYVSKRDALAHSPATSSSTMFPSANTRLERGGTWDKGKGCDTFGPIGPWLVTADEIPNPQTSTCGSTSTASSASAATPRP